MDITTKLDIVTFIILFLALSLCLLVVYDYTHQRVTRIQSVELRIEIEPVADPILNNTERVPNPIHPELDFLAILIYENGSILCHNTSNKTLDLEFKRQISSKNNSKRMIEECWGEE